MDGVRIITAHDGARAFGEMATAAKKHAERCGYEYNIESTNSAGGTTHDKPILVAKYLTEEWSVWMDADSMLLRPMDEVFEIDFDIALVVRPKAPRNMKRYGGYVYAGFVIAHNTEPAKQFLTDWTATQHFTSDQRNLNALLGPYLDSSVYDRAGEVLDCGGLKVLLLEEEQYCYRSFAGKPVEFPAEPVKIIHFVGRLHRDYWPAYKEILC
jgi:hypothetical protein